MNVNQDESQSKPERSGFAVGAFYVLLLFFAGFMMWQGIVGLINQKVETMNRSSHAMISKQDDSGRYWTSEVEHFVAVALALPLAVVGLRDCMRKRRGAA